MALRVLAALANVGDMIILDLIANIWGVIVDWFHSGLSTCPLKTYKTIFHIVSKDYC